MATYTAGVPFNGQTLGSSKVPIRDNIDGIYDRFGVDHLTDNVVGAGEHSKVTLNTYTVAQAASGTKSFIFSSNASASGTQLVYQPSIVTTFVPVSPRALARVTKTGATTYAFGNGPYGAATNFNAGSISGGTATAFTFNFSNPLATADYFVTISMEDGSSPLGLFAGTKTVNNFVVNNTASTGASFIIMVY